MLACASLTLIELSPPSRASMCLARAYLIAGMFGTPIRGRNKCLHNFYSVFEFVCACVWVGGWVAGVGGGGGWCGVVWCGVVWGGVVWCGVGWGGVGWCGLECGGVGWCGVVWGGVEWCSECVCVCVCG